MVLSFAVAQGLDVGWLRFSLDQLASQYHHGTDGIKHVAPFGEEVVSMLAQGLQGFGVRDGFLYLVFRGSIGCVPLSDE